MNKSVNISGKDILRYVRKKRRYLDIRFSRAGLAEELGIGETLLSQTINRDLGMTFKDMVRKERLKKATELMNASGESHLTMDDIAILSGFSNRMSLYRSLKQQESLTTNNQQ